MDTTEYQTRGKIVKALMALTGIYGVTLDEQVQRRIASYTDILCRDGYTYEHIAAALVSVSKTCKFFPSLAEIYDALNDVEDFAAGGGQPTAWQAWDACYQWARRNCGRAPEQFDSFPYPEYPEVEQAFRHFGGMEAVMAIMAGRLDTARAQYERAYKAEIAYRHRHKINTDIFQKLQPNGRNFQQMLNNLAASHTITAGKKGEDK